MTWYVNPVVNDMENKEQNDQYEFMTETIKKPPVNKRKVFKKFFSAVFFGLLFGVCACLAFVLCFPRLQAFFYPANDTRPVSVPVEENTQEEEPVEPFVIPENDTSPDPADGADNSGNVDNNDNNDNPEAADNKDDKEPDDEGAKTVESGDDRDDTKEDEVEGKEVVVNNIVETIEKELELDDYRSLLRKISAIAETTQKSLVTVSGISPNTDWFNNSYENDNSTTGIIVADNGKELLMVSPSDVLHNAKNVRVKFCDGEMYPARVKESDTNTGLCIVSIDLERISEETMGQIEIAQFGGLATSAVGVPVVAVGAPYGVSGSVGMGQITSNSVILDKTDTNVRIISTDIYASMDASGVLVNYNGRIVGIICHENLFNMPYILRAYSVSDISDSIEKMSNGQSLATLGIIGTDVTTEANSDRGVPFGAYVKEVVADSPAMNVGIRNGDVITKVDSVDIESFTDLKEVLLTYQPEEVVTVIIERPGRDEYTEITYEVTLEELK